MQQNNFMKEEHEDRIDRIVQEYGNDILRLCVLYLHDRSTAEDAAQDSLIKIDRKLDSFRGESSEKTWIMRIVANTCRDYYRTAWMKHLSSRVSWKETDVLSCSDEPAREEHERNTEVIRAVMRLKKPLREVILFRYYEEMTVQETARALRISDSAVNKRLRKAREQLKGDLWEVYFDE